MLSDEDCFLLRGMTTKAKEMIMRKCIWTPVPRHNNRNK